MTGQYQSWQPLWQKASNVAPYRHQVPSCANWSGVELFSYMASRLCTVSPGIHKFNVFFFLFINNSICLTVFLNFLSLSTRTQKSANVVH